MWRLSFVIPLALMCVCVLLLYYMILVRDRRKYVDPVERQWARCCHIYVSYGRVRIALIAVTLVVATLSVIFQSYSVPGRRVLSILCLVLIVLSVVAGRWRRRRIGRHIRASDYRVCPQCRYLLAGLPDAGRCPECGFEYSKDILIKYWEGALRY